MDKFEEKVYYYSGDKKDIREEGKWFPSLSTSNEKKKQTSNRTVKIFKNGGEYNEGFEITLNQFTVNLKGIKQLIIESEGERFELQNMILYNYKGLTIDTEDVEYIQDREIFYMELKNQPFTITNYLNHLEFLEEIESDDLNRIHTVKNLLNQQTIIMKEINAEKLSNNQVYGILEETRNLESIHHRHLCEYYVSFFDPTEKLLYISMELIKGKKLKNYLEEKGNLSEKEAMIIFRQVFEGVRFYHRKNIVHRDLNINNIMFTSDKKNEIKIIGFKFAKLINWDLFELCEKNKTSLLSPEVIEELNNFKNNIRLDMWALGLLLYRLVFSKEAFSFQGLGLNYEDTLHEILNDEVIFDKKIQVSKNCKILIEKLLEKNPEERIDTFDISFSNWFDLNIDKEILDGKANLTEREIERLDKIEVENTDISKRSENDNKIFKKENRKIPIKKMNTITGTPNVIRALKKHSTIKGTSLHTTTNNLDLTEQASDFKRNSKRAGTIQMNVNPLKENLDLIEKFKKNNLIIKSEDFHNKQTKELSFGVKPNDKPSLTKKPTIISKK